MVRYATVPYMYSTTQQASRVWLIVLGQYFVIGSKRIDSHRYFIDIIDLNRFSWFSLILCFDSNRFFSGFANRDSIDSPPGRIMIVSILRLAESWFESILRFSRYIKRIDTSKNRWVPLLSSLPTHTEHEWCYDAFEAVARRDWWEARKSECRFWITKGGRASPQHKLPAAGSF